MDLTAQQRATERIFFSLSLRSCVCKSEKEKFLTVCHSWMRMMVAVQVDYEWGFEVAGSE
jgi:hypothetical protein